MWNDGGPRNRIGIGLVLSQAIAHLKADLPAKIAELNTYYADDVTLVMPADDAFYDYMAPPLFISSYPAIIVTPYGQSRLTDHGITDEYKIARPWLVDVVETGSDWRELTLKLERWELAVFESLSAASSLNAGHTVWQATDWDQPRGTSRATGDLLQDLPMLFNTDTHEYPDPTA